MSKKIALATGLIVVLAAVLTVERPAAPITPIEPIETGNGDNEAAKLVEEPAPKENVCPDAAYPLHTFTFEDGAITYGIRSEDGWAGLDMFDGGTSPNGTHYPDSIAPVTAATGDSVRMTAGVEVVRVAVSASSDEVVRAAYPQVTNACEIEVVDFPDHTLYRAINGSTENFDSLSEQVDATRTACGHGSMVGYIRRPKNRPDILLVSGTSWGGAGNFFAAGENPCADWREQPTFN